MRVNKQVEFKTPPCLYGREHNYTFRRTRDDYLIAVCDLCYYCPARPPRMKVSTKRPKSLTGHANRLRQACLDICAYCGIDLCDRTRTVDHVVPRSRGGLDHASNYVLACGSCNESKGDKTVFEWLGVYDPPRLVYRDETLGVLCQPTHSSVLAAGSLSRQR